MALPKPERGLVISYAYLWHAEHSRGREEAAKNRPCVIILATAKARDGIMVTVAPITHTAPTHAEAAVEIPLPTKHRLALDSARSWIVVSEGNQFSGRVPTFAQSPHTALIMAFYRRRCSSRCKKNSRNTIQRSVCMLFLEQSDKSKQFFFENNQKTSTP